MGAMNLKKGCPRVGGSFLLKTLSFRMGAMNLEKGPPRVGGSFFLSSEKKITFFLPDAPDFFCSPSCRNVNCPRTQNIPKVFASYGAMFNAKGHLKGTT